MTPDQLRAIASIPARFDACSRIVSRRIPSGLAPKIPVPAPLPAYRYIAGFNPIFYRLLEGLKARGFIDGGHP